MLWSRTERAALVRTHLSDDLASCDANLNLCDSKDSVCMLAECQQSLQRLSYITDLEPLLSLSLSHSCILRDKR